ncbi:Gamma-glutamyltranspeptidase precursor [compost metagenome]
MKQKVLLSLSLLLILSSCQTLTTEQKNASQVIRTSKERKDKDSAQAVGTKYAIATQGRYATQAAEEIFAQGGNIIDATVAASFTVSVERPQSTGIGGGGFMIFREAKTGKTYAIDFRERAPFRASENMYIEQDGKPNLKLSQNGILAVGVPGLVAGLLEIHQRFGTLPLEQVMAPSIRLAEDGFAVYEELQRALTYRAEALKKDPSARSIFLTKEGQALSTGTVLVQKDLGKTLRLISKKGRDGFYKGSVASSIVRLSVREKGLISHRDLTSYKVKWREPVTGKFDGYEVYSMPPPSSGGIHVIQFLNFLENDHLAKKGVLSAPSIHLAASALQSSFADRAKYLGDPDFAKVPTQGLIAPKYVESRRQDVSLDKARRLKDVEAGNPLPYESSETTHLSIMDAEGNAVSTTQTVNGWMGAAIVAPGTGVLLNNEMDDFSAKEGSSNLFGAIGGKPNAIAPEKTPLSSMSPTILVKDGKPMMSVGAPGGTRIISCVAQTILNYIEFKLPLYDSVSMIRYHHQWQPDVLYIDPPGPRPEVLKKLQDMGYEVKLEPVYCNVMAVAREGDKLRGVADPRDIGTSAAK